MYYYLAIKSMIVQQYRQQIVNYPQMHYYHLSLLRGVVFVCAFSLPPAPLCVLSGAVSVVRSLCDDTLLPTSRHYDDRVVHSLTERDEELIGQSMVSIRKIYEILFSIVSVQYQYSSYIVIQYYALAVQYYSSSSRYSSSTIVVSVVIAVVGIVLTPRVGMTLPRRTVSWASLSLLRRNSF